MSATRIVVTVLACTVAACTSPTPRTIDRRPFSERLGALLGPATPPRPLTPVLAAAGRDYLTIDPWAGAAAGAYFGQNMDDVIAVWGPPGGLTIRRTLDRVSRKLVREIRLTYGNGLTFGFRDDVLMGIHVQNLDGAHLAGGPKLDDSRAAVQAVLGTPAETRSNGNVTSWTYQRASVTLELSFIQGRNEPEPLLAVISIERPGGPTSVEL